MRDTTRSLAELLGVDSLSRHFDHVVFCVGRGTSNGREGAGRFALAPVNGWRSVFNSERCNSPSYLMQEIGHKLGLVHSAADIFGNDYGDTMGTVSW